ncbi:Gldg family protein [Pontiella agarivorans]|uniref:Gldg family protein n=1 Tax=Pontiella agarivorans TaxID=3038953 RepID=A0ABU5MZH3_9BACT|nr:Gldg family protein [Pontiella agarivorans]MDZ8119582.1 Gldg family protein [Pontiella agarivorans]
MNHMKKMTGLAGIFLLLGILVAFNAVLKPVRIRADVTEDKLYTLSDGTKQLLSDLNRDVTLKFYFSKSNDRLPVPLKNFASRVRDLLSEYESRSGGYLVVEEFDPKPDSDEEEWAQRYGLQSQTVDMFGLDGGLYFGVVAVSGNREAVIPVLSQSAEPRLEYLLTRMVSEVSSERSAKVGIMSALPVNGSSAMNPMMMQQGGGRSWAVVSEIERQYDVEQVDMTATNIAEDIDTLVLIHPADISEDTLYALDQLVLRGGRLLAFTDAMCITAQETANPQMMQMGMPPPQTESDLNALTSAWGIEMTPGQLAADEAAASLLNAGGGRAQRNATWLSLREQNINREDIATGSLNDLMLPFAGAFEVAASNGVEVAELVFTADDGYTTGTMAARTGDIDIPALKKRVPLALRVSGTFKTAFPDREEGLKESEDPGVVILVSDVDMLADRIATDSVNFMGQTIVQPRNDNLTFAVNMVEQLCGSEALIGLRSRNAFDRPFDRVIELEKQAAFKWQAEEERLNAQLQATQAKLSQLQQSRDDGQQMFLTPEQEAEVKKFRKEVFETQQSLKEVRKSLRRDIEMLGVRLKAFNILGIPLLVAAFGIGRGLWMKKTR